MQRVAERVARGAGVGEARSLMGALYRNVEARGDEVALASKVGDEWRGISYADLWRRVGDFAAGLSSLGVGSGAKVAIICGNRPEWAVADLAAQGLGAATVPVYPTLGTDQIGHILADSGAVVAVVEDEELLERVAGLRDVLPGLRHVLIIEGDPGDRAVAFRDVEERGADEPLLDPDGWRALDRDDIATIIYTSGTTGRPKGVVLTHGNFLSNVEGIRRALPFRPDDVFLSLLPLSHVFERCGQYLALSLGAATYYAESIQQVPENLREVRPTVVLSVPRLYEKMRDRILAQVAEASAPRRRLFERAIAAGRKRYAAGREGRRLGAGERALLRACDRLVFRKVREAFGGRLRFFVSGGAKLEGEIGEFFYAAGVTIIEGYGLTETSPVVACNRLPVPKFGTVGTVLDHTEVRVSGEGEVQVRGPGVMRGYWNAPEAARGAFTPDGWYRTGDLGELDGEGFLKITDRLKNLIVLSTGKNVAPQPVESAIVASPLVSQAVVLGDGRKYVSALIVPDYDAVRRELGTEAPNEELADDGRCRRLIEAEVERTCGRFAGYERPKKISLLGRELTHEAGELTPTLKVKSRVVAERYAEEIQGLYS
ncbi:AMP-binding protein [Rubrobacter tropicus]|uniref:AMP-binding protein n=1 Tax=Rubrobacter tropicus TaxID=2653851 RepID=A0A6G8QAM8_9ACTN|nr:long-chain fatty acid--CoA ligase [Rubrobacter tropicus]QIN83540.1 AMP-binding protein [Rubrobacter tropicus]